MRMKIIQSFWSLDSLVRNDILCGHEQVSPSLTLPPPPPPHPGAGLPALPALPPGLIPPVSMSSSEDLSHQVRIQRTLESKSTLTWMLNPFMALFIFPQHQQSSSSDGESKGEVDQDLICVVCNDKSSGKHYGQFTCEGKLDLHCNTESALIMRTECMTFLSRARGKVPLIVNAPSLLKSFKSTWRCICL